VCVRARARVCSVNRFYNCLLMTNCAGSDTGLLLCSAYATLDTHVCVNMRVFPRAIKRKSERGEKRTRAKDSRPLRCVNHKSETLEISCLLYCVVDHEGFTMVAGNFSFQDMN